MFNPERHAWIYAEGEQAVMTAVRALVRPATLWMRVVSRASGRVMACRIVVRRCASLDVPAPGGPRIRTLWSQRLHCVPLY
jgi:hypothetical protein